MAQSAGLCCFRHALLPKRVNRGAPKSPSLAFSKTARWMDGVFLRVMKQSPEILPDVFARWFESVPSDQLVRFLQDQGRMRDVPAIIINSAHKKQFLRQLWTR